MLVAIPSKGRVGNTTSDKFFTSAVLFVPEFEANDYRAVARNVVAVPNEVRGITATQNWILKNTYDRQVVFIDDDMKYQGFMKLNKDKCVKTPLTEEQWLDNIDRMFDVTEDLDYKIFGVATQCAPMTFYGYKPILFKSYVTASFMGMVNDGTYYFDEAFSVKEDYELCLRHVRDRGGIYAARYLYWENSHWLQNGGCKDYRTQNAEEEAIRKLLKKYPGMIRQVKKQGVEYSIELEF